MEYIWRPELVLAKSERTHTWKEIKHLPRWALLEKNDWDAFLTQEGGVFALPAKPCPKMSLASIFLCRNRTPRLATSVLSARDNCIGGDFFQILRGGDGGMWVVMKR
jgi:hypothetical protein